MRLGEALALTWSDYDEYSKTVIIDKNIVYADGEKVTKSSQNIDGAVIEIRGEVLPYVGRGGLKLKGAIDRFGIDVSSLVCIDVGASTGGFTDCLLQHGAKKVYAVDCGHGQLDPKLLGDPRVISMEGFNARELSPCAIPEPCDIAVMDVSFISQTLIHPALKTVMKDNAVFLSLIKPQFELGRSLVGKKGIVKDEKSRKAAIDKVVESARVCGFKLIDICTSPITGGDGNIEYIGYFRYLQEN